jgi:hypothetical protein
MQALNFDLLQDIASPDSMGVWQTEASTLFGNLGFGPMAWPDSFQMSAFGRLITIHRERPHLDKEGELQSFRYSSRGNGFFEFVIWND